MHLIVVTGNQPYFNSLQFSKRHIYVLHFMRYPFLFIFRLTYYLHSHYNDGGLLTSALWDWNCRYDVIVYLIYAYISLQRIEYISREKLPPYASCSIYLVTYFVLLVIQEIVFNQLISRSKTVVHCIVIKTVIAIWNILQRL